MSRGAVSNKTFPGATGTEETKPGRKVRHTSRSQSETEVPDFHKNNGFLEWRYGDSNPGPLACHASALPAELYPRRLLDDSSSHSNVCWARGLRENAARK